jgi:hypothetical protein
VRELGLHTPVVLVFDNGDEHDFYLICVRPVIVLSLHILQKFHKARRQSVVFVVDDEYSILSSGTISQSLAIMFNSCTSEG